MAEISQELAGLYARRAADFAVKNAFFEQARSVHATAVVRAGMYKAAIETAAPDEAEANRAWWLRTSAIVFTGIGMLAIGMLAGPAIGAWLTTTRVAGAAAAATGLSAGTVGWIAAKGGALVASGLTQTAISSLAGPLPGTSVLGLAYDAAWNHAYSKRLSMAKFTVAGFSDLAFLPGISADAYSFTHEMEAMYYREGLKARIPREQLDQDRPKFLFDFWDTLRKTLATELAHLTAAVVNNAESLLSRLKREIEAGATEVSQVTLTEDEANERTAAYFRRLVEAARSPPPPPPWERYPRRKDGKPRTDLGEPAR